MSATDTIRAMLDERGVEWKSEENKIDHITTWNVNDGHAEFYESKTACPAFLKVIFYDPTPEQAIEATLGSAETAELRKERDALDRLTDVLNDANDRLLAENAELRELVRDMWHDARLLDANGHIDGMRLSDSKAEDYKRRMEELGVDR